MADTIFYYSDNTTSSSSDSFIGANSRDLNKTLIGVDVGSVVGFMDGAFLNCTSLVNVSLGNTTINISNNCFRGCTNLTTINIPNTVQYLGASAFRDCFNLSNVRIGSGVFQIGYNCFQNCTALSNIIIPSNVTQTLDSCFRGCSNLKKIYFEGNFPYFDGTLFFGTNVNLKLYRKKNFVTGWPNSFQGKPVVLWSDNVIKSGGTGKLVAKLKEDYYIFNVNSIQIDFGASVTHITMTGPFVRVDNAATAEIFPSLNSGEIYRSLLDSRALIYLSENINTFDPFLPPEITYIWNIVYANFNDPNDPLNGRNLYSSDASVNVKINLEDVSSWNLGFQIFDFAPFYIYKTRSLFPQRLRVKDSALSFINGIYTSIPSDPNDPVSFAPIYEKIDNGFRSIISYYINNDNLIVGYIYSESLSDPSIYYYYETAGDPMGSSTVYYNQLTNYGYFFESYNGVPASDSNIKVTLP